MRNADIKEVARETHRFFEKLRALMLTEEYQNAECMDGSGETTNIPESAAVRRASMDLTRALAKLRRSGRVK